MGQTTFSGPVRSLAGFNPAGYNSIVNFDGTTATTALTVADHGGRLITVNDADHTFTLPSIVATEPTDSTSPNQTCNLGVTFRFLITTASTGVSINTDGTDKYVGYLNLLVSTSSSGKPYAAGASDDAIDLNGTTKGGIVGSFLEVTAVGSATYSVSGSLLASGTLASPFATS